MSEKRYFTAVFPMSDAFKTVNPFTNDTPWGRAVCVSIGDATAESEILREGLEEIRDASYADVARIAEATIDKADEYIREQMNLQQVQRQFEERSDERSQQADHQPDTENHDALAKVCR